MIWLRSALFNLFFFALTFAMSVAAVPLRAFAPHYALGFAGSWGRMVVAGLRLLCGIRFEVTGLAHMPTDRPALIASMHQSAFDTVIWAALAPRFAYVLKVELTRVPFFGPLLLASGMIPIDRAAGAAGLRGMLRDAERAVADRRQIVIFPEGTRTAPGVRAKLHPGVAALAARTGLPVIPVLTNSGLFWGRRAFRKTPGVIQIVLLPPLPAGLRRPELLAALEAAFATQVGSPEPVDNPVGGPSPRL